MEVNEFTQTKNEQFATAENWSKGHVPTNSEQAFIPAGKKCEIKTGREFGALKVRGKLVVTTGGGTKLANSEAAPENKLVDLVGAESVSWGTESAGIGLKGTFSTTPQSILLGGFSVSRLVVESTATGKWELGDNPTLTGGSLNRSFLHEGTGEFKFGGRKVTALGVEFREKSKADFAAANFALSAVEGNTFMLSPTETTFTGLSSCTVEVTDRSSGESSANKLVAGAAKEIGTVTVSGFNITLENLSFGTLNVNNKGCAAGKGCKLLKLTTFTGTTVASNGTEAEPARLETTESGKTATLSIGEQETTGWLKVKDITVPVGPWYLPHGSNEGGNVLVGTTIKFESKSSSFSGVLANSVGLTVSLVGRKIAQNSLTTSVGTKTVITAQKIAKGALSTSVGTKQSLAASKVSSGALANSTGLQQSLTSFKGASGPLSNSTGLKQSLVAFKGASGALNNSVGLKPSITGSKSSTGALVSSVGLRTSLEAREVRSGSLSLSVGLQTSIAGQKTGLAQLSNAVGLTQELKASRSTSAALKLRVGLATFISGGGSTDIFPGSIRATSTKQAQLTISHGKQAQLVIRSHT